MVGQDPHARLQFGQLQQPVQRRQALPNLLRLGKRVAQLHGRASQPNVSRLHHEPLAKRLRGGLTSALGGKRQEPGQRRLSIRHRHERRPGNQHQRAPFGRLVDEIDEVLKRRGAKQPWIDVAKDHHVVGEQFFAPQRKRPQCRGVLLGMPQVGLLQHGVQFDGLIALEHVAQVAELEARIVLHQQDANLLLPNLDRPRQAIAGDRRLVRRRPRLDHELELADLRGTQRKPDLLRLAVGPDGHVHLRQHGRLILLAEHNRHLLTLETASRERTVEVHHVVDEHHVVG